MKKSQLQSSAIFTTALVATSLVSSCTTDKSTTKPNIVIIYADDMGYGDLSCQNPNSKIQTPNLDRLASEGMRFTDAHSSSGVSSPSRFGLLTGNYHWRRSHKIIGPFGETHFFREDDLTLPAMLKESGYTSLMVGKWHLGWDWNGIMTDQGRERLGLGPEGDPVGAKLLTSRCEDYDFTRPFNGGPTDRGFDYYFGDGTINFPPYCWIENKTFVTIPTLEMTGTRFEALEGKAELRPGPLDANWTPEKVLPTLTDKAVEVISKQSADQPFFLYFALSAPHAPIVPTAEYHNKSGAGYYGDFVVQCDDIVGRVVAALKEQGLYENTIILFSADNGPEHYAYPRQANFDHNSTESLRGLKRDVFEGGHRVPFIVKWDKEIEAGAVCDEVIGQVDIMATVAAIVDYDLPNQAAVDSYNMLPVWKGESYNKPVREAIIHNTNPDVYGVRQGDWVMINSYTGTVSSANIDLTEFTPLPIKEQPCSILFNLKDDQKQVKDLADEYPEKVEELAKILQRYQDSGRSIPERR